MKQNGIHSVSQFSKFHIIKLSFRSHVHTFLLRHFIKLSLTYTFFFNTDVKNQFMPFKTKPFSVEVYLYRNFEWYTSPKPVYGLARKYRKYCFPKTSTGNDWLWTTILRS